MAKANKISLEHAKENKLFYFVANVVVYRESDSRCLILKRGDKEKVHPGKYCVPGGKLEWDELDLSKPTRMNGDVLDFESAVEELLVREAKEEAGVEIVCDLKYINSVAFVRPDEIPVILVKFAAKYKSGEVKPEPGAFSDFAWVNADEVKKYECIKGIPEEIERTITLFQKGHVGVGIGVMIVRDGKVLLGRRHGDPAKADSELHGEGTWTMPGGKLEVGESFEKCAAREVYEETGMRVGKAKVICINNDKNEHAHFVTVGMLAEDFEGEPEVREPDEITEWRWFDLNNLPEPVFFCSAKVIENYRKGIFYIP